MIYILHLSVGQSSESPVSKRFRLLLKKKKKKLNFTFTCPHFKAKHVFPRNFYTEKIINFDKIQLTLWVRHENTVRLAVPNNIIILKIF